MCCVLCVVSVYRVEKWPFSTKMMQTQWKEMRNDKHKITQKIRFEKCTNEQEVINDHI